MGTLELTITAQQANALVRDGVLAVQAGEVSTSYGDISIVIDVDRNAAPAALAADPVDLSQLRGVLAEGYTPEDIDRVLPQLERALGVALRCVWEYVDEHGFGGQSTIAVMHDGRLRDLDPALWDLLVSGNGDGLIAPARVASDDEPDFELRFASHSGANEDRRVAGAKPPPAKRRRARKAA
jgi:hypothetical protein